MGCFLGVAFRVKDRVRKTEKFYLRPTNGKANDPERRSHAVQYVSKTEYCGSGCGTSIRESARPLPIFSRMCGRR
jgi:hypothetical protein